MNILVVGTAQNVEECREKFGARHAVAGTNHHDEVQQNGSRYDVIFDFLEDGDRISPVYQNLKAFAFFNSVRTTLLDVLRPFPAVSQNAAGFNGLPGFLNLPLTEVTVCTEAGERRVTELALNLGMNIRIVADQPGMVTARIILMIINEAYFTVEDGTASQTDIDMAMKLGTNYPFGPFEWAQRIGTHNVFQILERIRRDTGDSRYNVSNLLRSESLSHLR
jgi:3-hydroxybutyryl-CoA dehydrogenase